MATVQAVVQEGWREILARIFSLDVLDGFQEMATFKVGEAGFIDVPPKEPVTPDPTREDLFSEGDALTGGGTCEFSGGSAIVAGSGTSFLADVSPGEWIKPGPEPHPSLATRSSGDPGTEEDIWGQVLSVDSNIQITLAAVYAGPTHLFAEARPCHKAAEPFFTFRKGLTLADVLFSSGVPAITEITAIVLATEGNLDQLGNNPEFFELGVFDANGVMLLHMTFPLEQKTGAIQLNHVVELVF